MSGSDSASFVTSDEPPSAEGELRLALAMRGGVSLAVWIGGAAAEVDRLCRATDSRDPYWAWLRRLGGYDSAVVDVMSGASVGGLNAVIAAAATTYDFSLDGLRSLWVEVGSLGKMIRRRRITSNDDTDGISLLNGDEYFLAKLDETLVALVDSGENGDAGRARRVDVTLAATLLEPIAVQRIRGMADTTELRYESTFRFRHGGPVRTDFPTDHNGRRDALARLALAGRATSSFPAAFEAAEILAPRPPTFTAQDLSGMTSGRVSMTGVFGESTAGGRAFCVMDGGVLDNIPIARAIDAIIEAPADGPTRRVLVYVQPGSAGVAPDAPAGDPDRSTVAVVTALVRTRVQEETIAVDLRQLESHNRRAGRARLGAVAAIRALDPAGSLSTTTSDGATRLLLSRYSAERAAQETSSVTQLLDDPIRTLGHDPFPTLEDLSTIEVDRRWRAPLSEVWETVWAQQLGSALAQRLNDQISSSLREDGHALTVGAGPLRRLTIMLIDACNATYRCARTEVQQQAANTLKASLYRILATHAELVDRPRRLAWVVLAVRRSDPDESWIRDALSRIERLTSNADALDLADYLNGATAPSTTPAPLAAADVIMRGRLDARLSEDWLVDESSNDDIRDTLLDRLVTAAQELARASDVDDVVVAQLNEQSDLGGVLLAWLRKASDNTHDAWVNRLAALETATFDPESPDGSGNRPIDFVRLSGANPTPLAAAFPELVGADVPDDPWFDIVDRLRAEPPTLTDDAKLAGNKLMNFAAFLREAWRENDWMWGRLDAVVTLVDVLVEPARVRKLIDSTPAEGDRLAALNRWFRRAVVEPNGTATSTEWRDFLEASVWNPRAEAINQAFTTAIAEMNGELDGNDTPIVLSTADLSPLRTALIATRQWQVLAELLPAGEEDTTERPLHPKTVVERANTYAVGNETVHEPPDPRDRELVQQLAGATRAMLDRPCTGVTYKITRVVGLGVRLLDWLWLDPTDHPRRWASLLILIGLFGVSFPVWLAVDGTANGLIAGTAGVVGAAIVTGLALLTGFGLHVLVRASLRLGLALTVLGAAAAVVVGLVGGLTATSVIAAVVSVPVLLAGIVIAIAASRPPKVLARARRPAGITAPETGGPAAL